MKCTMLECVSGEEGVYTIPGEDDINVCPTCWFDDPVYGGGTVEV